jgi:hypothetical protein
MSAPVTLDPARRADALWRHCIGRDEDRHDGVSQLCSRSRVRTFNAAITCDNGPDVSNCYREK